MKNEKVRKLTVVAMLAALSSVLMFISFPVPLMPGFIKFDFSELPALIASYAFGGIYGVIVCLVKNLINLPLSTTSGVGELSNFILGASFVYIAGIFYKLKKTRTGALSGALTGSASMALISMISNYFIVYPFYINVMGMPSEAILGMYRAINPNIETLWQALAVFNVPFTFIKGLVSTVIAFLIYKPLSPILKGRK